MEYFQLFFIIYHFYTTLHFFKTIFGRYEKATLISYSTNILWVQFFVLLLSLPLDASALHVAPTVSVFTANIIDDNGTSFESSPF